MLESSKIWLDGKLMPFGDAKVHILSHSFARGSGLFEVMGVHTTKKGPAIFRLDDHVKRLKASADLTRMKLPMSQAAFKKAVKETVKANDVSIGFVKIICFYGGVEFEVIPRSPKVSAAVVAVDMLRDIDAERFNKEERRPAEVTISSWRKADPRTMPVEAKSAANYLGGMIAKMDAIKAGFTAPILLDHEGCLAEGATESLFLVKNGKLKTPKLGNILAGITRRTMVEIARDINLDVIEKKMKPRELLEADEAFLTSSVVKAWPISRVDDVELPAPGQITRLLDRVVEKIIEGKAKEYNKWLTVVK